MEEKQKELENIELTRKWKENSKDIKDGIITW